MQKRGFVAYKICMREARKGELVSLTFDMRRDEKFPAGRHESEDQTVMISL